MTLIMSLFVVTAAIYSKAAYLPFCVIDDGDYVVNNHQVMSGISFASISWAFSTFHSSNWHPVTWLSLMLDSQLFGSGPMGFHLVNVFLHALNTSLLFLLFSSMTGAVWRSAFVVACFALHPLHVESVAWIAERKDVLSTLFWMLTLLWYCDYVRRSKRSGYFLSLTAFALGLMAKPMLVTVPVTLFLLDLWPLERLKIRLDGKWSCCTHEDNSSGGSLKSLLLEKIPFILLAAASSVVTLYAQKSSISTIADVPLLMRVTNALWALVLYVKKMLLPLDLSILYPHVSVPIWKAGCAAVVLCGVTLVVLKYVDRRPYLAFGWFWYLVTLLPVLGIVQVGRQSMADRYSYIPLIGLFAIASWGGGELCTKIPKLKNLINVAAIGIILFYSIVTWVQLSYWRENTELVGHALEVTENNSFLHYTLGLIYAQQGKTDLAVSEYRESLRIDPANSEAYVSLGLCFENSGKIDWAIGQYQAALLIQPNNPQYHIHLADALFRQGMIDDAIGHLYKALELNPGDEIAVLNLEKALRAKSQMPGRR